MINGVPDLGFCIDDMQDHVIDNETVLNGFVMFGVWFRHSLAYDQVKTLQVNQESFSRMAATATFYSALGALVEDVTATLISWICWERSHDVLLADVLSLMTFHKDKKAKPSKDYVDQVIEKLIKGERNRVDIVCFSTSLKLFGGAKILEMIGLHWKY